MFQKPNEGGIKNEQKMTKHARYCIIQKTLLNGLKRIEYMRLDIKKENLELDFKQIQEDLPSQFVARCKIQEFANVFYKTQNVIN